MLAELTDLLKEERGVRGRHVLFLGSGAVLRPLGLTTEGLLQHEMLAWAGDRVAEAEGDRFARACELFSAEVSEGDELAAVIRPALATTRPSEGHIRLAQLIKREYFSLILSTTLDDLLDRSLQAQKMDANEDYLRLVVGVQTAEEIEAQLEESKRVVLIKLLGDLAAKVLPITREEIEEHLRPLQAVLRKQFRKPTIFVEYADRDAPVLDLVPRDGGRIFWVSRRIPMADEELYEQLRVENPTSVYYHEYRPQVIELLRARHSEANLLVRDPGSFDQFFARVSRRLGRRRYDSTAKRRTLKVIPGGPFRLFDHFDVKDEELFCGREKATDELAQLVDDHRLVTLFGACGIGKTSLLRAGLTARLTKTEDEAKKSEEGGRMERKASEETGAKNDDEKPKPTWVVVYARCGLRPVEALRRAALEQLADDKESPADPHGHLAELFDELGRLRGARVLIILDQFEQYFARLGPHARKQLLDELVPCRGAARPRLHLLLSVREDYLAEMYGLVDRLPDVFHHLYRVPKLTRLQAKDAMVKPASFFEINVGEDLVTAILEDLDHEGVDPAELQVVLDRLYESLGPTPRLLTAKQYIRLGRANAFLGRTVVSVLDRLSRRDREMARGILLELVGPEDTLSSATSASLASVLKQDKNSVERVIAQLLDARLIRALDDNSVRRYELMHERIIDEVRPLVSEQELRVRGARAILDQQLTEYELEGELLSAEQLEELYELREELALSRRDLRLILLSAAAQDSHTEYWFGRLQDLGPSQLEVLRLLLQHEDVKIREVAVRALAQTQQPAAVQQLIDGLADRAPEVRERAVEGLHAMDRELVEELRNGKGESRRRAAFALGKIQSRRAIRPLVDLIERGDQAAAREATVALEEIHDPRAPDLLLKRLVSDPDTPWSVAYALGQVGSREDFVSKLGQAVKAHPDSALLTYAYGRALALEHRLRPAREALDRARTLAQTQEGRAAIDEALRELAEADARASAGDLDWPAFHKNSRHTGHTLQQVRPPLESKWHFKADEYISTSPVIVDGSVFVGCRGGHVHCLDARTGEEQWRTDVGASVESTPAFCRGRLVCASIEGTAHCLRADDGRALWQTELGGRVRSSFTPCSDLLYIGTQEGEVLALSVDDGGVRWRRALGADIVASPAVHEGMAFVGSWDEGLYALDAQSGELRWRYEAEAAVSSSAAVEAGRVIFGSDDGSLHAVEVETGKRRWRAQIGGRLRSSPAIDRESAYIGSLDGALVCCALEDGAERWRFKAGEEISSSPAVADKVVFVGSRDGALYGVDADTGTALWEYKTAYGVVASPAVYDGMVFIPLNYYEVHAFASVSS